MAEHRRDRDRRGGDRREGPRRPGTGGKGGRNGGRSGARPRRRPLFAALRVLLLLIVWGGLAGGALVAWYAWDLPDIDNLQTPPRRPSVTLLAEDGSVLATYGDLYGGPLRFDELPPYLVQAIVATEDRRFFDHPGVDAIGILRAVAANLRAGAIRQGGSTLTQQLAKNLFLTPERSLRRKVQEALLAFWLEARFDKKQLFTLYVNRVYFGAGTWGVEAAARRYFGKSAREISLREASLLAGLLKAPSRYSPARDPEAAARRADQVLANMIDAGFISEADAKAAREEPLLTFGARLASDTRYFADWALDRAAGHIGHTDRDIVVRTTFSPALQRLAERRIDAALEREGAKANVHQAALVALSPDGAVRAMVGGRSYGKSQFNRATQALRQPGSAFKLFVYLAALEAGMTPGQLVADVPIRIGSWEPRNFDGRFRGPVTMEAALVQSLNSPTVQLAERAGLSRVIGAARRLGITTPIANDLSIALGSAEVTLIELTAAYAALANGGYTVWPHAITEIRDRRGRLLWKRQGSGATRSIEPETVARMNAMLARAMAEGTGRAARLDRPAAGKTGTSQDFRDAWFVGYTAELVTGVWVGNDDSRPMKHVTGGGLPARIWRSFMADALIGMPPRPLPGLSTPTPLWHGIRAETR